MNNLSIFLYLADVIYSLLLLAYVVSLSTIFFLALILLVKVVGASDNSGNYEKEFYPDKYQAALDFQKNGWKQFVKYIAYVFCFIGFLQLIPSKETLYMIAASEAGEMVVTSDEGKEVISDLKEILKTQLQKLKD